MQTFLRSEVAQKTRKQVEELLQLQAHENIRRQTAYHKQPVLALSVALEEPSYTVALAAKLTGLGTIFGETKPDLPREKRAKRAARAAD
jgi:hypothetical protein